MIIRLKLTRAENGRHYGVPLGTIIELDLEEEYLPICISSEIYESPDRTPMEAKKAQAIAARTYVAAHAAAGTVIDDTATYQAFRWKAVATIPNCQKATEATAGQALMYGTQMITAWYSNSNGGRTKRSDEAWSSYKPWTIAQDDPWDTAGRALWGEVKPSHSVGMSQIGAAYAARIGKTCAEILRFYYPNTLIVTDYGRGKPIDENEEEETMDKTNTGLVSFSKKYIGQPYWYGTCVYPCTSSLLASKSKQYPSHYTASRMPRYQQDIAAKKTCADCIGLLKGYLWEKDGVVKYNAATDYNTGGLYNRATVKGPIQTIPEVPGLIVYKTGHVGMYEGNGSVIEAKGFAYGIIRSKLTDTKWTDWVCCPDLSYAGYEDKLTPNPFKEPYEAIVSTKRDPLNIWADTKKSRSLLQVPRGDTVRVVGDGGGTVGWLRVQKDGVEGYADGQYLTRIETPDSPDDPDDADDGIVLYQAKVQTKYGKGIGIWATAAVTGTELAHVNDGAILDVLSELSNGWREVRTGTTQGFANGQYLVRSNPAQA